MLTPEERRGALLILGLVLLGGAWDFGRAGRNPTPPPVASGAAPIAAGAAVPDTVARTAVDASPPPIAGAARDRGAPAASLVDVNRAGMAELDALPGIGPVLARRIVEHRTRNGAFRSLEELRAVRGIGPSLIARLRGRVRFGP